MDGLFIIIAIFIGIANFAAKQKQNQRKSQGGMKRQPNTTRQDTIQQWMRNLQQPDSTVRGAENRGEEGLSGTGEHQLGSMLPESNEGFEIKDRNKRGSLGYMQQSQSSEGICTQHPEHERQKLKEKSAIPKVEVIEEGNMFDLTEESLLRSIVMAEVLGPPRAMKRRIR